MAGSISSKVEMGSKLPNSVEEDGEFDEDSLMVIPMKAYSTEDGKLKTVVKRGYSAYSGLQKPPVGDDLYASYAYVSKKGRSVYLGRYTSEEEAARAHDIVTLKCSGPRGVMNFPAKDYQEIMRLIKDMTDDELIAYIRRSGSRFARGCHRYRGVGSCVGTKKWLAQKGKGKGGLMLGTYDTEEEAAMAYDIATIKAKGWAAQTNFTVSLYDVEGIHAGTTNPEITEEVAKKLKQATVASPYGAMPQSAVSKDSRVLPSEIGFPCSAPQTDESSRDLLVTAIDLSYSHRSFRDPDIADYSGKQGSSTTVDMFHHSSSGPFKPYQKETNSNYC